MLFSLIRSPFVHRANGNLLFFRLLTKKQTKVIRLQHENQSHLWRGTGLHKVLGGGAERQRR
jgi:hypothetical protein